MRPRIIAGPDAAEAERLRSRLALIRACLEEGEAGKALVIARAADQARPARREPLREGVER